MKFSKSRTISQDSVDQIIARRVQESSKHKNQSNKKKGGRALVKVEVTRFFLVKFLFLSLGALANTGNDKDYADEENVTRMFGFGS